MFSITRITGHLDGQVRSASVHCIVLDDLDLARTLALTLAYVKPYAGTIRVAGSVRSSVDWGCLAFISKKIRLSDYLTVEEHVMRAVRLRFSRRLSKDDCQRRVGTVLTQWGLVECRPIETLHKPQIIIADSILEGLSIDDQGSLLSLVSEYVKKMECAVILVECSIKPHVGSFLDSITLLAMGSQYYCGPSDVFFASLPNALGCESVEGSILALNYLITHPAVSENDIKSRIEKLAQLHREHDSWWVGNDSMSPGRKEKQPWPIAGFTLFTILLKYQVLEDCRNWKSFTTLLVTNFAVFAIIATIFFQLPVSVAGLSDRAGLLYFFCINLFFGNSLSILIKIDRVRKLLKHERTRGIIRSWPFVCAQYLAALPLRTLSLLVFGTAVYYITGLRTDGFEHYLVFMATILLMAYVSLAVGVSIAMGMGRLDYGQILVPFFGIVFFIFGNLATAPNCTWILRWIQYVDPIYYAFQCLMQNELEDMEGTGGVDPNEFATNGLFNVLPLAACLPALAGFSIVYLLVAMLIYTLRFRPIDFQ